jgi:hypothetical protein
LGPKAPEKLDPGADEAWVRRADGEQAIRMRLLNALMARGAQLTEVRLLEDEDGIWTIQVRLTGHKGAFIVNHFDSDEPKTYKDVNLAIRIVWADLGYKGNLLLTSEREHKPRARSARGGGKPDVKP